MSASPLHTSNLAQALAEYRSRSFTFDVKSFTSGGSRRLFEFEDGGLVPNLGGCQALTDQAPGYFPYLLEDQ